MLFDAGPATSRPIPVRMLDVGVAGSLLRSAKVPTGVRRGPLRLSLSGVPFVVDVGVRRVEYVEDVNGRYRIGVVVAAVSPELRRFIDGCDGTVDVNRS